MKKIMLPVLPAALFLVLLFSSCDNFFSSSWGTQKSIDDSKVKVTPGNADQWVERAVGDPKLADTVGEKINEELEKNASSPSPIISQDEKNALTNAGMELAVISSGIGESVFSNAADSLTDLLEDGADINAEDTEKKVKEILEKIQTDFTDAGGPKAADNLSKTVLFNVKETTYEPGAAPEFDPEYVSSLSPGLLAETVMVLVLGAVDKPIGEIAKLSDVEDMAEGLTYDSVNSIVKVSGEGTPSDKAIALAACVNLLITDVRFQDNAITGAIRDAFLENK